MKLSFDKNLKSAISLTAAELALSFFVTDGPLFSEELLVDDITITLSCAMPPLGGKDSLATLEIPPSSDRIARRDFAAACAFVFCSSQGLSEVGLLLSKDHIQKITIGQAKETVCNAVRSLLSILHIDAFSIQRRAEKLANLHFPYSTLRTGQKLLMQEAYGAMRDARTLFTLAPTGIGKTLSVLYPALKALGKGHLAKVFYLTPRGSLQPQIAEALLRLEGEEPFLHSITLFAKQKLCPHAMRCSHDRCPERDMKREMREKALPRLFETEGHITAEAITQTAKEFGLCPFELSLDASLFCDVILCDYNYIFDPQAGLRRYRGTKMRYALLVDEAHNLVSRVRESFSAVLSTETIAPLQTPLFAKFENICANTRLMREALAAREKEVNDGAFDPVSFSVPEELCTAAEALSEALLPLVYQKVSAEYSATLIDTARAVYFDLCTFSAAAGDYDEHYAVCSYQDGGAKIALVDPCEKVRKILTEMGMAVLFSATLSPKEYYLGMLGGTPEEFLDLPSPFDPSHFKILSYPISTIYNDRDRTAHCAAEVIFAATRARVGNYMVFFPSFEYLNRVVEIYRKLAPRDLLLCQTKQMNEKAREEYLNAFNIKRHERLLGFAVMGGLFSEGVDLTGDKLLGEVIFGVGMPPPSLEAEAVRRRFDDREEDGRALGYTFPGFNRVLQSAGRVIRTDEDRGFLLLCDERYETEGYRQLFPSFWEKPLCVTTPEEVNAQIQRFWAENAQEERLDKGTSTAL